MLAESEFNCAIPSQTRVLTLAQVIDDYQTPPGATFQRHFIAHVLSPHIEYLIACRPMSISMGNAIRWLKLQITKIDPDEDDSDAKMILNEAIDDFLRERVIAAANEISEIALNTFEANDTILVYGKSFVVTKSLVEAHRNGKKFNVIVVDSRPLFEGKAMAQTLTSEGIEVKYTLINGLGHAMKRATKVFLGAHALMSNGVLYSRVGTAQVAMEANDNNVPVIVLSEIVKCTDKVTLDSILFNEVADADELQLPGWRDVKGLQVLNIMHDATPAEYITNIITEAGIVPTSSIAVLHRWQHDRDERKDEKDEDDD